MRQLTSSALMVIGGAAMAMMLDKQPVSFFSPGVSRVLRMAPPALPARYTTFHSSAVAPPTPVSQSHLAKQR